MAPVHRPVLHLLVSFGVGIALGRHLHLDALHFFSLAVVLLIWLSWRMTRGEAVRVLPHLLFVTLGVLAICGAPDPDRPPPGFPPPSQREEVLLVGKIGASPKHYPDKTRVIVSLEQCRLADGMQPVSGGLMLTMLSCRKEWPVGQRFIGRVVLRPVRNFNNPGGFDYRRFLADQAIWLQGMVRSDAQLIPLGAPDASPWMGRVLASILSRSRAFLGAWLPPDLAALFRALVLGDDYALSDVALEGMYAAGLGHLIAISGFNLALVAGLAFLVFRAALAHVSALAGRWGVSPLAGLAAFPLAFAYAMLTGMEVPVLRATLMLAVVTLSLLIQRPKDSLNFLSVAALGILIAAPQDLFSASFQLSFGAVAALIWIPPRLPFPSWLRERPGRPWHKIGRSLYQFILISVVASVATAPLALYHFHRFPILGLPANLVVVPIVALLVQPAGLLALLLLPLSTDAAGFVLTLGSLGLKVVLGISSFIGNLSWATLWPGAVSAWQVTLSYALLGLPWLRLFRAKVPRWGRIGMIAAGCLILAAHRITLPSGPLPLRVTYLDVGQGNAAVVELPEQGAILIDGGGFPGSSFDVGRNVVAPYLWHRRIHRLEAVVLSHAHPDHFRGLVFIAANVPVKEFWYPGLPAADPDFATLMETLDRKGIPALGPRELSSPRVIQGVEIRALHPSPDLLSLSRTFTYSDHNKLSLVLHLRYGEISFLFPGDIDSEAERRLLALNGIGPTQVLLAPHHGSRSSSSVALLERLKPRIAVFSVGFGNPFHFPAPEVGERYRLLGVRTYRTDINGAVTVVTDGERLHVETFAPANYEKAGDGEKRDAEGLPGEAWEPPW
jgi:competence protein ComEC